MKRCSRLCWLIVLTNPRVCLYVANEELFPKFESEKDFPKKVSKRISRKKESTRKEDYKPEEGPDSKKLDLESSGDVSIADFERYSQLEPYWRLMGDAWKEETKGRPSGLSKALKNRLKDEKEKKPDKESEYYKYSSRLLWEMNIRFWELDECNITYIFK